MKFLLFLLASLVSAAEEPLPVQEWAFRELCRKKGGAGKHNTIYIAGQSVGLTAEDSHVRMLMREVKFFNQYKVISMTFYVRINGKCQLQTIWADKTKWKYCTVKWQYLRNKCPKRNGNPYIPSVWIVQDAALHFPNIYFYPEYEGGLRRMIHFVSHTTILFEVQFLNDGNYNQRLAGALATGTNITEEMWEEYVNLTQYLKIPTEYIENVYETDTCPKWVP